MSTVVKFLKDLHDNNNNREWFTANKGRYLEAKRIFESFAMELVAGIRTFDESIGNLSIGEVTYRIYRDVRFSKNKAPYKCHMGVYVCRGGKKSGYSGYYFHVSADDAGGWETGHIVAAGDYMTDPAVLKILREDIAYGNGDFRRIVSSADSRFAIDTSGSLKKVPASFPADSPDGEYFKLKHFCLCYEPDDKFVLEADLVQKLVGMFRSAKPFVQYINRAISFAREENQSEA